MVSGDIFEVQPRPKAIKFEPCSAKLKWRKEGTKKGSWVCVCARFSWFMVHLKLPSLVRGGREGFLLLLHPAHPPRPPNKINKCYVLANYSLAF